LEGLDLLYSSPLTLDFLPETGPVDLIFLFIVKEHRGAVSSKCRKAGSSNVVATSVTPPENLTINGNISNMYKVRFTTYSEEQQPATTLDIYTVTYFQLSVSPKKASAWTKILSLYYQNQFEMINLSYLM
jgi:hypothetical protein